MNNYATPSPNLLTQFISQNKTLNNYTLGKILGKGGFATVYQATSKATGQQYALKRTALKLNASSQLLSEDARRIINEISLVSHAAINAEHVVNCYDAWCEFPLQEDYEHFNIMLASHHDKTQKPIERPLTTPSRKLKLQFYILFELCSNTLDEYLFEKLPLKKALSCVKEISDGLHLIHLQGIIHRDIKPSNLFISNDGKPKLGDFGLSVMLKGNSSLDSETDLSLSEHSVSEPDQLTNFLNSDIVRTSRAFSESFCDHCKADDAGSLPFFAPEQVARLNIDQKVDIFALGIVLYLMVVGFSTSHEKSLLIAKLKEGEMEESLKLKHPELSELILKMVSKCSEERPSAIAVGEKLGAICKTM